MTLDELENEVIKDDVFFRSSGGGVTLSGGEVLMQAPFATRFLERLRRFGVHTAIETAGDAPLSRLMPMARQCDEVLFDLKIMDAEQALAMVGMNLPRVLDNFRQLVADGINVIPRVPLIPGYTLNETNMARVLAFLLPSGIRQLHLLPFHQYGEPKYRLLGQEWGMRQTVPPTEEEVSAMRQLAEREGFKVTLGG